LRWLTNNARPEKIPARDALRQGVAGIAISLGAASQVKKSMLRRFAHASGAQSSAV